MTLEAADFNQIDQRDSLELDLSLASLSPKIGETDASIVSSLTPKTTEDLPNTTIDLGQDSGGLDDYQKALLSTGVGIVGGGLPTGYLQSRRMTEVRAVNWQMLQREQRGRVIPFGGVYPRSGTEWARQLDITKGQIRGKAALVGLAATAIVGGLNYFSLKLNESD